MKTVGVFSLLSDFTLSWGCRRLVITNVLLQSKWNIRLHKYVLSCDYEFISGSQTMSLCVRLPWLFSAISKRRTILCWEVILLVNSTDVAGKKADNFWASKLFFKAPYASKPFCLVVFPTTLVGLIKILLLFTDFALLISFEYQCWWQHGLCTHWEYLSEEGTQGTKSQPDSADEFVP